MELIEEIIDDESYRDAIATVDESGNRIWIYARKPKGWYHRQRVIVAVILLTVFFATPLIWVNGHPLFLFNLFERKFIILGNVFAPQDFHLLALAMITFFVFIILFTVVFGRVWCGWACPQTVFMEMVFRKIEYWIEGDANQQRKLNAQPWNTQKMLKKGSKQLIFVSIAILIAHTTLAYLIGIDQTLKLISNPPDENLYGFLGLLLFTFIFYGVFAYFREQACIAVCPYGRLQGVLLGKDSMSVTYDFERGEPRGKLKSKDTYKEQLKTQGDCIDCKLCVQVCPTGIDIRNGTQLECVNCTACIDACDQVMEKIQKPSGLIRYASYNNIIKKTKFKFTPRIIAYSVVLTLLIGLDVFLLTNRGQIETTILRERGSLPIKMENGDISNIYSVQVTNKTFEDLPIRFVLKGTPGKIQMAGGDMIAVKNTTTEGGFFVVIPASELNTLKNSIQIEVWSGKELKETVTTNFLGPIKIK
ncbi:MAG: cytochrome c oxidase accessory protein CcoG [Microscillaceae bacterium]|nr:cytochrome c oxidase accessory protein CcoG [Microscillaceae bacterium]